jgi:3-O-methylgallate 3,4-dioxygenase
MARIVLGIATSHSPMLSTPWEQWGERVNADRQNPELAFRGGIYGFDALEEKRCGEPLAAEITPEKWRARHAGCQAAIDTLATKFSEVSPDVAVIIGNDQRELWNEENMAAFTVFWGEEIANRPRTKEQIANLPPGIAVAERGHAPPQEIIHPGMPDLGRHIIRSLIAEEFDVGQSARLPRGTGYVNGAPHAFGFVYRRIMHDRLVPNVPVILNTFYPPNQIPVGRCVKLGKALKRAIESWDADKTVAVFGSGGLSHFVVDETLDRKVLAAMGEGDLNALAAIDEAMFQSGTSEIMNWITHAAVMAECGMKMNLLDYIPCYRSLAGTGNAMGFACWEAKK